MSDASVDEEKTTGGVDLHEFHEFTVDMDVEKKLYMWCIHENMRETDDCFWKRKRMVERHGWMAKVQSGKCARWCKFMSRRCSGQEEVSTNY